MANGTPGWYRQQIYHFSVSLILPFLERKVVTLAGSGLSQRCLLRIRSTCSCNPTLGIRIRVPPSRSCLTLMQVLLKEVPQ